MCTKSSLMELNERCVYKVVGLLLWKTRTYFTDERALSPRSLWPSLSLSLPHPPSISPPLSLFLFPPSLFPLWEIMWLFDLRRDEWQWFSKSSPVSITLRVKYQPRVSVCVSVCMCISVYVPCLTHNAPSSVTLWQKALIFQFYHTPLSQLSLLLSSFSFSLFAFFPSSRPVPDTHSCT